MIKLEIAWKTGERGIDLFELDAENTLKITLGGNNYRYSIGSRSLETKIAPKIEQERGKCNNEQQLD